MNNAWSQNTKYWYHLSSVDMKSGLYHGPLETGRWYIHQLIVSVLNMFNVSVVSLVIIECCNHAGMAGYSSHYL